MDYENEQWRDIPNAAGLYQVSNDGRVRRGERILKHGKDHYGTHSVTICVNMNKRSLLLAGLILETFGSARPLNHICAHRDGNKDNLHINNLYWAPRPGVPKAWRGPSKKEREKAAKKQAAAEGKTADVFSFWF